MFFVEFFKSFEICGLFDVLEWLILIIMVSFSLNNVDWFSKIEMSRKNWKFWPFYLLHHSSTFFILSPCFFFISISLLFHIYWYMATTIAAAALARGRRKKIQFHMKMFYSLARERFPHTTSQSLAWKKKREKKIQWFIKQKAYDAR